MVARHYYRNDAGTLVEIHDVPLEKWTVKEASEEGSPASVQIEIPDPDMTLDFYGHRRWITYEDTSEDANEVIFSGFVGSQIVKRQGEEAEPTGRIWQLTLYDMNVLWDRRILRGTDTKRPEETDVARMEWLVATSEMGYIDDVTLIASGNTVTLDKRSVRGQFTKQVADECAQQAGKNYWLGCNGSIAGGTEIFVWYGKDTLTTYASDLSLSNDPSDWNDGDLEDGSSTVWPVSFDAEVERNPDRVYDGAYVEWEKGAVYRRKSTTTSFFTLSGRDLSHPAPEIKSKARAIARANRLLNQSDTQLEIFRGTVELPAAKASKLRSGMRVAIRLTHVPGWESFVYCRILNAMPEPVAAGERYRIKIEAEKITGTTCSTVLASRDTTSANVQLYSAPGTVSMPFTTTVSGIAIGAAIACNTNVPSDSDMVATGSWTTLLSAETPDITHPALGVATKQVTAGSNPLTMSYSPGFSPSDASTWAAVAMAVETSATSPVQTKYGAFYTVDVDGTVTLDSPPTPGNLLVMVIAYRNPGTDASVDTVPIGDWTLIEHAYTPGGGLLRDKVSMYARCVSAGDGSTYGYVSGSIYSQVYVMEWEL